MTGLSGIPKPALEPALALGAGQGETSLGSAAVRRVRSQSRALMLAVILLLCFGATLFAWLSYLRAWESAENQVYSLADRNAVLLEFLLGGVEDALGSAQSLPAQLPVAGAAAAAAAVPQLSVFALDAQGEPLQAWRGRSMPSESKREAMALADRRPGTTAFATPFELDDRLWSLGLVRLDPGAPAAERGAAYLAALFRLDAVAGLWNELMVIRNATITIISSDDRLWMRHPLNLDWLGQDLSDLPELRRARLRGQTGGSLRLRYAGTDDVERLLAWRLVPGQEMIVVAGLPVSEIWRLWAAALLPILLLAAAMALATIAAIWLYGRSVVAHALQREATLGALAASELRFRDFADASSDWYWETDSDHRFLWFSDRIVGVLGISREALLGRRRLDLVGGVIADSHYRRHLDDLTARRPFRDFVYRVRLTGGGGRWIKVSGKPVLDAEGRFLGYRGTGSDIDAQRMAEERAEILHRRLVEAFEASLDGIALFDAEDRLILANGRYKDFFFPHQEHLVEPGLHFDELVRRVDRAGQAPLITGNPEAWHALRRRQRDDPQDVVFELADGRWLRLRERLTARGDCFRVFSEISDFKRREEELRQTKETAELANRAKSEFLAVMSHELRTPLNAIIGFSDILMTQMFGALGNERYLAYARDINQSGRHLLEVINDILDISKAEAGKLELHEGPVAVEELVDRALAMMVPRAQEAGVLLSSSLPTDPVQLLGDRRKLLQMLLNLLSNAVKFTPSGGHVALSVALLDASTEALLGAGLEMVVVDDGIGIAPENLVKVQEPFIQLDSALTRQREGTGLGLPLAKRLAELHGGRLELESTPGQGTRVRIVLPALRLLPTGGEGAP